MRSVYDWQKLFWEKIDPWLDKLARQAIPGTAQELAETRETCKNQLLDWLQKGGFAEVQAGYQQKASPEAYFIMVIRSRLTDCRRQKLGRPRVPRGVQRKGSLYEKVYELYYLKKQSEDQIVNALAGEPYHQCPEETLNILYWLWAHYPVVPRFSDQEELADQDPAGGPRGAIPGELEEVGQMVAALWERLMDQPFRSRLPSQAVPPWVWQLRRALTLEPEERLVLQMRFRDDLSIAQVTKLLRLKRHQVSAIEKTALQKIRQALEQLGFGPETLAHLGKDF